MMSFIHQSESNFLGDLSFKKICLYRLDISHEIDLSQSYIAAAKFGGPIAVFPLKNYIDNNECDKNQSATSLPPIYYKSSSHYYKSSDNINQSIPFPTKPKFLVYSASGQRISVGQSRATKVLLADWTHNQMLVILETDGTILVYNVLGKLQQELKINLESIVGTNATILDAQLVNPQQKYTALVFVSRKSSAYKDTQPKFFYCPNIPIFGNGEYASNSPINSESQPNKHHLSEVRPTIPSTDINILDCYKLSQINIPPNTPFCWSAIIKQSTNHIIETAAVGTITPVFAETLNSKNYDQLIKINILLSYSQSMFILEDSLSSQNAVQINSITLSSIANNYKNPLSLIISSSGQSLSGTNNHNAQQQSQSDQLNKLNSNNPNLYNQQQQQQQQQSSSFSVIDIAVSFESTRVALLLSTGKILILSLSVDENGRIFETKLREFDARTTSLTLPDFLIWCGLEAICAVWNRSLLLIGVDRDYVTYSTDGAKHYVAELDCLRLISAKSHEMLFQVAPVCNEIFRIATMSSSAILVEAYKDFLKKDLRCYEAIQVIKEREELNISVLKCIQAAGQCYDIEDQKLLLNAARFGKCFVPSIAISEFSTMCKYTRILNTLRQNGIPVTYSQLEYLTIENLLTHLMNICRFDIAIWIAKWLRKSPNKVLTGWAFNKVRQFYLTDDQIVNEIVQNLGKNPLVPYADIAESAVQCNRVYLALKLIEFETHSSKQIPILLNLREFDVVFPRAIESCDSNLIYMSIFALLESSRDEARFNNQLKKHTRAFNYYAHYLSNTNVQKLKLILHSSRRFDDESRVYLRQSFAHLNDRTKISLESKHWRNAYSEQIEAVVGAFKNNLESGSENKANVDFSLRQLDIRSRLVKFQYSLASSLSPPPTLLKDDQAVDVSKSSSLSNAWIDLSPCQTIINLLMLKESAKARECEKIVGLSDKKIDYLKQIAAGSLKPLPPPGS